MIGEFEWLVIVNIKNKKINYDNKSEISLDVNDLTTDGFWCLCKFCCEDWNPIMLFTLELALINELLDDPIKEFIGTFDELDDVGNKESNADKSGLFCWIGGVWLGWFCCHIGLHWGCWGCSWGWAKLLKLWLRFGWDWGV